MQGGSETLPAGAGETGSDAVEAVRISARDGMLPGEPREALLDNPTSPEFSRLRWTSCGNPRPLMVCAPLHNLSRSPAVN